MAKITAKGTCIGRAVVVVCTNENGVLSIEVNGLPDAFYQEQIEFLIEQPPAIGGTYYPEPGTMLAVLAVLERGFFDTGTPVEVEIDGDIGQIPADGPPDAVY